MGKKSQDVLFSQNQFCSLLVWDLLRLTPWVFWCEILRNVRHYVYCVLADIWAPDSSHKLGNKYFIDHCQGLKEGSFVCETVWFFSWVNTHPFDLKFFAFVPNSGDILTWNSRKKLFWGNFLEIFVQTNAFLYRNLKNFALLSAIFILRPYCAEKIHASTFICFFHPYKEARP